MTYLEFLSRVLARQAAVIHILENYFGPVVLLELLERRAEETDLLARFPVLDLKSIFLTGVDTVTPEFFMGELETVIANQKLNPEFEFYLWSYPLYRQFIESSITFDSVVDLDAHQSTLETHCHRCHELWIDHLKLPKNFLTPLLPKLQRINGIFEA